VNCENCNPEALCLIGRLQSEIDQYNDMMFHLRGLRFSLRKPRHYLPDHAPFRAPR
jgi:hypothetical protein